MTAWFYDWFPLPGQAVFDRNVQEVAAVSRAPGNLDLFVVGNDNRVWSTWWNEQAGWAPDWFPLPGQAVFDRTLQKVAAVSRAPGNLDLFIVGNDDHVWTTYWNDVGGWSADWFPLPGQAVFDRTLQQVAAVSRTPENLDVFIVGNDDHVWTSYWNAGGWAPDWFPLPGQAVFDRTLQQVAAVSRGPENLDVFIVGNDDHVWSSYWNDAGWAPDFFPLSGQAVFDRNVQRVAAVSRGPFNLDLFIVGFDDHIWSSYWNESGWAPDWFPLPGQAVFDRNRQRVAAVSRGPFNLDLFIVGFDDHIWSSYWNESGWAPDFFPLPSQAVFDRNVQQIAAVSRARDNLDLFIVGNDDHVWSTFWGAAELTMAKLIDNGSFGEKVTMVVVGDGFTAWDQDAYNQHVDELLVSGLFTHDFYAANEKAFNLVRLNVLSNQSGVSTKTYDANGNVTGYKVSDTYFGAIFNGDWAHCWVEDGPNTNQRLNDLLNQWVPDRKLTFLLLNNPGFGGCGGGGRLTLPLGVSWSTVAHECGHALGRLADEYHQKNDNYTGGEPGAPNATINTDRTGLKWAWAVASTTPIPTGGDDYRPPKPAGWDDDQSVGLFEGAMGNYATGVYRPVVNCRMRSNDPAFCPVCNAAMSAQTNPFLGPAPSGGGAGVAEQAADSGYVRIEVHLENGKLTVVDAHQVEGRLVQPEALTHGLVHEVLVDGRQVAVGTDPDAGIARSFEEPGYGPGGHHTHPLGAVDLTVRVPAAALAGVDPSKVTINVHDVAVHPGVPLAPLVPLAHQPTLARVQQASVTLDQLELPAFLHALMAAK